jgi:hypothetical protein
MLQSFARALTKALKAKGLIGRLDFLIPKMNL